jgi:hypothetical protein
MKITKGQFCQFSLQGRLRLINMYGRIIFSKIIEKYKIQIFKIFDFHVQVIRNIFNLDCLLADPIPIEIINFYINSFE